eukprot:TRINITY_DN106590_c0_g1_i1.p1 TRINITY_DN106590_c0_g1~~TRINITY_DN106590_c0_g1_i1.p1  ORF type:complete len:628 (-),score=157.79 TRINITY_DN106590_c0_g1_i1:62-1915(-)
MGSFFSGSGEPAPEACAETSFSQTAQASESKSTGGDKVDEQSGARSDASTDSGEGDSDQVRKQVPFRFHDLVEELEGIRADPPAYISRLGKLRVPNLVCNSEGVLQTPQGEGPWIFTVAVSGGSASEEDRLLAESAESKAAASKEAASAKAKGESELLEAKNRLEELSGSSEEADLDEAAEKVKVLQEALGELKKADKDAKEASKLADVAKEKVRSAEAYDSSFVVGITIDRHWPVKPPVVRFQGVMHHALVDDSGGMLLPFYRTLPRDERKAHTLRLTLRAIHEFLVDPLESWGIARESAPTRLLASIAANEKMNRQRLDTIFKYRKQVRHEELFEDPPRWREEWFDPSFWKAHKENSAEAWRAILVEHLEKEVFSFKIFTDEFCEFFIEEVFNFYASGLPARRPNSMNNYGIILNEIGLEPMIDELQHMLQPLGELLWSGPGSMWDGHHCFMVRYREGEDLGLDMHTDDSDVTFNMCLGLDFDGAGLQFCGLMGAANHRKHTHTYKHVKGTCVCHLGRKRHGADDISRGERLNLILWNHSSTYRKTEEYENPDYSKEEGPPDQVCVSYTHDRDYGIFKEYPTGKEHFKGRGWCPPKPFEYKDFKPDSDKAVSDSC